jgi:hypothetical protein
MWHLRVGVPEWIGPTLPPPPIDADPVASEVYAVALHALFACYRQPSDALRRDGQLYSSFAASLPSLLASLSPPGPACNALDRRFDHERRGVESRMSQDMRIDIPIDEKFRETAYIWVKYVLGVCELTGLPRPTNRDLLIQWHKYTNVSDLSLHVRHM